MSAIDDLYAAYTALRKDGWRDVIYAPKDGTEIEIIELGSTGIHKVSWQSFDHQPLDSCGRFFGSAEDFPSHPVLWRPIESDLARGVRLARGSKAPPLPARKFA